MTTLDELARRFQDFGGEQLRRAPLYARLSSDIAHDPDIVALLLHAPEEQQIPVLLFAAVHYLLLDGRPHELSAFYPNLTPAARPADDAFSSFRSFVREHAEEVIALMTSRNTQTNEVGRCALFLPALSMIATEAGPLALVDVGTSAGLNLLLSHYSYDYRPGGTVGPSSPVHVQCDTRGAVPVPPTVPPVAATIGLDAAPIDVRDPDAVRWLEACVWPDQADRFDRLRAAVQLAQDRPPDVRRGDAVDDLAATVAEAAGQGHPVVMNSWMLNYLSTDRRIDYVESLDALGERHDLSWVLAESPAQTPGLPIPTTIEPEHLTVLSLVTWRRGRRTVRRLASCHPHGFWLHWE
jgi:hypothetical protein